MFFLFQRVGERFLDLDISSVLVAAMDVSLETPPPEVPITLPTLPAIMLLPGDDKEAPFRYEGTPLSSPWHSVCFIRKHCSRDAPCLRLRRGLQAAKCLCMYYVVFLTTVYRRTSYKIPSRTSPYVQPNPDFSPVWAR